MFTMESERLVLRGLQESDVVPLTEMLGSPRVMRWLFCSNPMGADDVRSFIEWDFTFGRLPYGLGVLSERNSGRFVGFAGLLHCRFLYDDDFELGCALQEDSWGKGYCTEISGAQIDYGFRNFEVREREATSLHMSKTLAKIAPFMVYNSGNYLCIFKT